MSRFITPAPRPETADLHRRILAAAVRNGHTEHSFRHVCILLTLRDRTEGLLASFPRIGPWVRIGRDGAPNFVWSLTRSNEGVSA